MRRVALLAAAAAVVALALAGVVALRDGEPEGRELLVPAEGALFGAYVNPDGLVPGTNVEVQYQWRETVRLEGQLGRRLDVVQFFWSWEDEFPGPGFEGWALERGTIPMISWHGTELRPIVAGRHDAWIAARARAVKALDAPVFLRFAWEMNGDWYPWSGFRNGANLAAAKLYREAWRRVHGIFAREDAMNAIWVWAPNYASIPNARDDGPEARWNDPLNYYPGDAYVDWVGIDAYNVGEWLAWDELLRPSKLTAVYDHFAERKPIVVAETASQEAADASSAPASASKAAWIEDVRRRLPDFPAIRAFLWFHQRTPDHDFRADSSPQVLAAFRRLSRDPYFRGVSPPGGP